MAFSEFYLTQGAGASNVNGGGPRLGANDGPIYTSANATVVSGSPTIITDNTGGNWGYGGASEVQVGDWLCWDIAGVKEYRRITDVTDIAIGAVTVHRSMTAGANKSVYVGGAWQTLRGGIANLGANCSVANWPASTDPPRLNIKHHNGTAYNETTAIATADFGTPTVAIYPVIQAYASSPGDLDWRSTTSRAVIDFGALANHAINLVPRYSLWLNLDIRLSNSSLAYQILYTGSEGTWLNCVLKRSGRDASISTDFRGVMMRCRIDRDYDGTSALIALGYAGQMTLCEVVGNGSGSASNNPGVWMRNNRASLDRCLIRRCGDGVQLDAANDTYPAIVSECTIVNNAGSAVTLLSESSCRSTLVGNVLAGNGGYGIKRVGISGTYLLPNAYCNLGHNNTSGLADSGIILLPSNETLAADPFEDYSASPKDLRIKAASAAYGVRNDLPSGLDADASFLDAGAIMRLRSAGSGGAAQLIGASLIGSGIK